MARDQYDAIVVGARCAGSPTAMLLARKGYRVLLVDRGTFPSDTVSTHILHPPGVAILDRWGLRRRLEATDCPPIDTYSFDFGPFAISGSPGTDASPVAYAPRRLILDQLLVDAAVEAGAELREAFTVEGLIKRDGRIVVVRGRERNGRPTKVYARVVIGADGLRSVVARTAGAAEYRQQPRLLCGYYAYWSGLPMYGRYETYIRDRRGVAAWPTHQGLTVVVAGWPFAEFAANKSDVEGNYLRTLALAPELAARLTGARRETRIVGAAVPNYFRRPYGPGWALVGDAGYTKDFITGQGMSDAFRDAENCVAALDDAWSGRRTFDEAMAGYHSTRDAHVLPMYEFTTQLARLEPPPPALQQLLGAIHGHQPAMDAFVRVNAGVTSPAEFFAEANVNRMLAAVTPAMSA
jgi:flavin-dependent dehydrogenase